MAAGPRRGGGPSSQHQQWQCQWRQQGRRSSSPTMGAACPSGSATKSQTTLTRRSTRPGHRAATASANTCRWGRRRLGRGCGSCWRCRRARNSDKAQRQQHAGFTGPGAALAESAAGCSSSRRCRQAGRQAGPQPLWQGLHPPAVLPGEGCCHWRGSAAIQLRCVHPPRQRTPPASRRGGWGSRLGLPPPETRPQGRPALGRVCGPAVGRGVLMSAVVRDVGAGSGGLVLGATASQARPPREGPAKHSP